MVHSGGVDDHRFGRAVLDDASPLHRELCRAIPDVYKGFAELPKAVLTAGALEVTTNPMNCGPATGLRLARFCRALRVRRHPRSQGDRVATPPNEEHGGSHAHY